MAKTNFMVCLGVGLLILATAIILGFCVCHKYHHGEHLKEGHGGGHGGGHGRPFRPVVRGGFGGNSYGSGGWGYPWYDWWYDPYYYVNYVTPPENNCGSACMNVYKACIDSGNSKDKCSSDLAGCVKSCV